jgi:D-amino peptidase
VDVFHGIQGAKAGTANAILDHTISSSTVYSIIINGKEMPEVGINALVAGYYRVPVVLVTGDQAVCEQTKEVLGDKVVTAAVKEAVGRYAAKNLSHEKAHQLLREQTKRAIEKRKEIQRYALGTSYTYILSFLRSSQADMSMLVPGVKRLNPRTVQFELNDYLAGFKLLRALIALGRE